MLFWFAGLAVPAVAAIFASRALDYRLVLLGAVLPTLELVRSGSWVTSTLAFPTAVMLLVMIVGWGRRRMQRRWLGVPIGLFCHLILNGAWARPALFWWPLGGGRLGPAEAPGLRPLWAILAMEIVGAVALWWWWRRFGLNTPERRRVFWRTGRLEVPARRGLAR